MKKNFIIITLLFLTLSGRILAQTSDNRALYERKVKTYNRMKNMGIGFGAGGAVGTVIGIALIVNGVNQADSYYNYNNNYNSTYNSGNDGTLSILGGVVLTELGIASGVTGIILGCIGTRKMNYYNSKLKNLSVGFNGTPQKGGIALSYKF